MVISRHIVTALRLHEPQSQSARRFRFELMPLSRTRMRSHPTVRRFSGSGFGAVAGDQGNFTRLHFDAVHFQARALRHGNKALGIVFLERRFRFRHVFDLSWSYLHSLNDSWTLRPDGAAKSQDLELFD